MKGEVHEGGSTGRENRKRNGSGKSGDRFKAEETDIYQDGPLSLLTVQPGVFFEECLQLLRSAAGTPFLSGMRGGAPQDRRGLLLLS